MRILLGLLFLMGCSTPESEPVNAVPPAASVAPETTWRTMSHHATDTASVSSQEPVLGAYTYFLTPSQALLDAEFDNQRNMLENLGTSESKLRVKAFEDAVGMIASMLDTKYGNHVTGEVLPSTKMMIVKSDQELDLSILKDLISNLENTDER